MRLRLAVLLLVLSFPLALAVSPPPTPSPTKDAQTKQASSKEKEQVSAQNDNLSESPPSTISKPVPIAGNGEEQENSQPPQKNPAIDWNAVAAIMTAIFTGALVIVGRYQGNIMKKQADLTREALELTKKSNETSRQALEISERGQLVFSDITVRDSEVNGIKGIRLISKVKNIGRTFATAQNHRETCEVVDSLEELPEESPVLKVQREPAHISIPPGETVQIYSPLLTPPPFADRTLCLFIDVEYRDEFGNNRNIRAAREYVLPERRGPAGPIDVIITKDGYNIAT